jgi:glycosyltransferase involved in cell wall biosynthesis
MKILTIITSYNRKKNMLQLVKHIKRQGSEVIVFDDNSDFDSLDQSFIKFERNYGKKLAYLKFQIIFKWLKTTDFDYYILIPDDIQIDSKFIMNSITTFKSINTSSKLLNLLTDNRLYSKQWTQFEPIEKKGIVQTQWTDLCFITNKQVIDMIQIKDVSPERWTNNENLGSGVGGNLSRWLDSFGVCMYHPYNSIVKHGKFESLMNTEERKTNPLDSL